MSLDSRSPAAPYESSSLATARNDVIEMVSHRVYTKMTIRKQKSSKLYSFELVVSGGPSGVRTPDTLIKSQVLCQLS